MKQIFICLLASSLFAAPSADVARYQDNQKIAVQNQILAKVNGTTISVMDIKKRMDVFFYQNYPQLADSAAARHQFYEMSWKRALIEMIDNELMVADATEKEMKLTDGEVRETMGNKFGPNVMQTLDKIGLTYDEAWKLVRNEMIVQRMSWYFVHDKAAKSVTPQKIKLAYRSFLEQNPAYAELSYKVVSIKMDKADEAVVAEVHALLKMSEKDPNLLEKELKAFEAKGAVITVSKELKAKSHELSISHKSCLEGLDVASYSSPSFQTDKLSKKGIYKIFYLGDKQEFDANSFEAMAPQLQSELTQKAVALESKEYFGKLHKRYGIDPAQTVTDDLHPFSIQ